MVTMGINQKKTNKTNMYERSFHEGEKLSYAHPMKYDWNIRKTKLTRCKRNKISNKNNRFQQMSYCFYISILHTSDTYLFQPINGHIDSSKADTQVVNIIIFAC